jgi:adenosylcobinamide-GDP ribazoletransferase
MKRLILAITFLTRIPLPVPRDFTSEDIGRSTPFFPLVGLLIGLMLIGIDGVLSYLWPPIVVNSVLFVSLVAITGGLHLDGLMDTCDGIFSGRDRDRILEIMRDSRVGAFGVLGAVCLAAMKIALLNALNGDLKWAGLLLFPMLGRWSMVLAITVFPYARESAGLGTPFTEFARKRHILWATLPVLAVSIPILLWRIIPLLAVVSCITWLMGKWISRRIGGLTGDNYGAICEVTETLSLMAIAVVYVSIP